jgi:hypothetical protein
MQIKFQPFPRDFASLDARCSIDMLDLATQMQDIVGTRAT